MSKRDEIMKWFQTNVVWKPEALKDQKAFKARLEKLANLYADPRALCSPWFREPRSYPRAPRLVGPKLDDAIRPFIVWKL